MKEIKWAVLGCGVIANEMAVALQKNGKNIYAVGNRTHEKAAAFAEKYGFEKAYGSYEELVNDPEVELIYIATPHPFHIEQAKLCINHGKPVLCEKPFTVNAVGAKEVFALAKEKEVFITEAIWTRYLPSRNR